MSVFTKYRRNMSIDWGIDTKEFPFVKCSDIEERGLLETEIPIFGIFTTPDSGYGEGCIVILENELLSIPQRYLPEFRDYMDDPEVVEVIKAHKAAIIVSTFVSNKYKKKGYDVEFKEI